MSASTPAFVVYPNDPAFDYGPAATDVRHLAAISGSYELPLGREKRFVAGGGAATRVLVSGFTLSKIANPQTGLPSSPQLGYDPTGSGDTRNPVRPDVNTNCRGRLYPKTVGQYFNPAAFQAPAKRGGAELGDGGESDGRGDYGGGDVRRIRWG